MERGMDFLEYSFKVFLSVIKVKLFVAVAVAE